MTRFFFLGCMMLIVPGCDNQAADALQSGNVIGLMGIEGRWTGPVVPKSEGCGPPTKGQMSVERKTFAFDPFQATTVIDGTVSGDGALDGVFSRPGGNQQTVSISFSGMLTQHDDGAESIDGQLVSGHCAWTVSLKRG